MSNWNLFFKTMSRTWMVLIAVIALGAISSLMYFSSRAFARFEVEQFAEAELRMAESEIGIRTMEMETAVKMLAALAEKHVNCPDSVFADTHLTVRSLYSHTTMSVAYIPEYFPEKGRYFEACSSRMSEDSIYTRQIGSDNHDYTQMEWFQNGFSNDECWWSEPYFDNSGAQTFVISCSYPVHNSEGEVVAVACVEMPLDYLQGLTEYLQTYSDSYYSIRSAEGIDIVRGPGMSNDDKFVTFEKDMDTTGWKISMAIQDNELIRDFQHVSRICTVLMFIWFFFLLYVLYRAIKDNKIIIESTELSMKKN